MPTRRSSWAASVRHPQGLQGLRRDETLGGLGLIFHLLPGRGPIHLGDQVCPGSYHLIEACIPSGFCYPTQLVGDLFPAPTKWLPVTGPVAGPGLSKSCSLFALDGERRCHGDRITGNGKTPPTAVDLRAGTEFPGFHGG